MIKVGMILGLIGISLMLGPVIKESVVCVNEMNINGSSVINATVMPARHVMPAQKRRFKGIYDTCLPLKDLLSGTVAIILAPILWGIAAGK